MLAFVSLEKTQGIMAMQLKWALFLLPALPSQFLSDPHGTWSIIVTEKNARKRPFFISSSMEFQLGPLLVENMLTMVILNKYAPFHSRTIRLNVNP